ncbi:DUF7161 family protein [Mycobacteroides abscessus]|uniref:DUF7161 family protein n=1 Tax=Mycobacteroides abscessus TaxID=36809 RepID=UPI000C263CE8|nr:ubiD family decarboxylase [Mycobacteroides abscessus]
MTRSDAYQPIPYDAKGLRGLHARIVGELPLEYGLPEDIKDVVIADDEPNIYSELAVYIAGHPDRQSAVSYSSLEVQGWCKP